MMQKYGQIRISADKVKRTYVKKAFPEGQKLEYCKFEDYTLISFADDHPHFLRQAADLANVLRNTIFVDQVSIIRPFLAGIFMHRWPIRLYTPYPRGKMSSNSWRNILPKTLSRCPIFIFRSFDVF